MTENNGLRDGRGGLIGGLIVEEFNKGFEDFEVGNPPPALSSPSYDLGRQHAARRRDEKAALDRWLREDQERRDKAMRELLPPDAYEKYRESIEAIRLPSPREET